MFSIIFKSTKGFWNRLYFTDISVPPLWSIIWSQNSELVGWWGLGPSGHKQTFIAGLGHGGVWFLRCFPSLLAVEEVSILCPRWRAICEYQVWYRFSNAIALYPSMHLNITTVPPRKACLSPAWLAVSGVWGMVPMFLGLGVLVCSVLALVFLSPEGQGNLPHPPSPIGVQRPCHSCIPFKARSAFFLRNTEIDLCFPRVHFLT